MRYHIAFGKFRISPAKFYDFGDLMKYSRKILSRTFFLIVLLCNIACAGSPLTAASDADFPIVPISKDVPKFRVETVAANLEIVWSIVFTTDGRMFFTERPGRVRVIENGKLRAA
ncbi:MAG: PQQ-dependent sugar dehydrogenase, partial [Acidobacteria bacterium]|nr:PQQ-dependent sugar dehydrogenase [Acidobacteriota bacterium]